LHGLTIMANSLFNGWRMEDVWLERKPNTFFDSLAVNEAA